MPTSRFPCRVCGQSTEGVDTYVICVDCAADFDSEFRGYPSVLSGPDESPAPSSIQLSPDEIEARLRHLLDDW